MNAQEASAARFVRAASVSQLAEGASLAVKVDGHVVALFRTQRGIFAVDNRCPHMGFPLDRGTVKDCILICHWHHARFDLTTGGTFDQWADDVRSYPVKVADGGIFVDVAERGDPREHHLGRLRDGLERNLRLVIAKSVTNLIDGAAASPLEAFRIGLDFGTRNRRGGWGTGLTILTCMMNIIPPLETEDRPRAMYQGLAAVAEDSAGHPPRFVLKPLPGDSAGIDALKRWFRQFVQVRDSEGAERCIVSAVRSGTPRTEIANMLFAAATDYRYLDTGHVLDFTNKALEALDHVGWDLAEPALASLASLYADGARMEEDNAWRHPIDLVPILERAFESIPDALEAGSRESKRWSQCKETVAILLGEDPNAIAESMLSALREGCTPGDLAGIVAYAAGLRIARFPTSNEFGDWDTAHHTFTFANAVHQGLRRVSSPELVRGAFDAAMSVYLDRFLNVPAVKIPESQRAPVAPREVMNELPELLNQQQQVHEAGAMVARYLGGSAEPGPVMAALGRALLREDRNFHTIQDLEAAFRQSSALGHELGSHMLVATARYLAAHAPTVRSQEQTYRIAMRLRRGDRLFEEE